MKPRLSLAMIAKDEEHNLDECLRSVKDHVDEIIVVDTGSADATPAVAERHGARVHLFTPETDPQAFYLDDENTCAAFGFPRMPGHYTGEMVLGDFGAARRRSFDLAAGDFVLWLDADDVLEGAEHLRAVVDEMAAGNLDMSFLAYDYARDHLGRTFYRQWRERVLRRGAASWVNPVHEVLMPARPVNSQRREGLTVIHRRKADRKTVPHRNYKILLRLLHQEKQNGTAHDPRTLFYLGQEARWIEPQRAVDFYEEYLRRSGWAEERAAAHMAQGSIHEFGQLPVSAEDAYARADREYAIAAAEMPGNPDGLFGLARIAYLRGRWQDCVDYTQRGFAIGNTESMLGANPMDRLFRPHVYYNHALGNLGRFEEAAASCRAGLAVCPDDPAVPGGAQGMLTHNLKCWEEKMTQRPAEPDKPVLVMDKNEDPEAPANPGIPLDALVIYAMQIWKQARGDEARERAVLDGLAPRIAADPVVARMRASTDRRFPAGMREVQDPRWTREGAPQIKAVPPPVQHAIPAPTGKKSVVIYTGPAPEPWDPRTPEAKGLGGSETAAIEVAKNLAALGHVVTIYGDPPADGIWDGVAYAHHSLFKGANCDVFISSRAPWAVEQFGPIHAGLKLLWVHDIHCGPNTPDMERWLLRFDRVLCLSQWHKSFFLSCYPSLPEGKVVVTRNGIDPRRFDGTPTPEHIESCCGPGGLPKTNSMVWSSSPNRGLDVLLANFPLIRSRVPDAELHIFYGFDTWEQIARQRGATAELAEIERFRSLIRDAEARGGARWHGKRPQREVAEAYMRAKVWPYMTIFQETSCITAMEAQAAGCVPVCSTIGALPETVKHGVLVDIGRCDAERYYPRQEGYQEWFDAVVRCLTDESYREPIARAGREWALGNLSWRSLAKQWSEMFDNLAAEVAANPIPQYVEVK